MSDVNTNPNDPQPLADEELANVSGGAIWNANLEESSYNMWHHGRYELGAAAYQCDYEEWLNDWRQADQMAARAAWIAAGKPKDQTFTA